MKKILVTGGDGRMGNVLVRHLLDRDYQVRVMALDPSNPTQSLAGLPIEMVKGDVRNVPEVQAALDGIDIVFHLAAKISLYPDRDGSVWATNVEGTRNMASLALEAGVEKFIHCSSHAALEKHPYDIPLDETRPLAFDDKTVYHRSKAHGEQVILDFIEKGLPALIVNPGTIIGPYDFGTSLIGQALIDLVNGKLSVIMEGSSDYSDARDVADGMIGAMEKGEVGERYFLTGHLLTMRELAQLLEKITQQKMPKTVLPIWMMYALLPFIQFGAWLKGEKALFTKDMLYAAQSNPVVLHDKAKAAFGFEPRALELAFSDSIQWYKDRNLISRK
ncbi:MAG: NAD-dependent epimerase/dehydratase family protein [Bacteroidota bacterium]